MGSELSIAVRVMNESDVTEIARWGKSPQHLSVIAEAMTNQQITVVVAEENGIIVGTGALRHILGRRFAEIWLMETREDARGRGVGTAVIEYLEAVARALGRTRVTLEVEKGNAGALRLYERLGYQIEGESVTSWLVNTDGVVSTYYADCFRMTHAL